MLAETVVQSFASPVIRLEETGRPRAFSAHRDAKSEARSRGMGGWSARGETAPLLRSIRRRTACCKAGS